jgi:hypothetical protein
MGLDKNDVALMQEAFVRALKQSGFQGGGGSGSGSGSGPSAPSIDPTKLNAALDKTKEGVDGFIDSAKTSTDTFRGLTKAGSNFSNDIIGMNVAAAQSRLSLGEFADLVAQNGKNMAGLGGSVTRGTEAFAKVSKGFFEGDFTTRLQEMGMTAKDLNEVLAVQLGTQRSTFKDTEEGRRKAYESAASLAREMDMIAKLTGKNREQQMEEAKKRAADGQVEAKLRLIGIEQGAEAEAAARAAFQEQFAKAEARGMGQMAKEMFATGTLTSNEAATQYALLGEAAQKTGEQMQHLSKGNVAAADAASKQADAANAKNQRDPTLLRLATLGDAAGVAGNVMKKNVEDNMALHDSIMAVSKTMKPGLTGSTESFGKALDKVRADIETSSRGVDARGRQVSGATQGVIAAQRAGAEFRAGVAGAAEAENARGESVANAARRAGEAGRTALDRASGPGNTLGGNIERAAQRGQQPETVGPRQEGEGRLQFEKRQADAGGGIVGLTTKGASELANVTATALEKIVMKVQVIGVPKEGAAPAPQAKRQGGSLEMTGNIFENWGKGTLVELHGMEGVVRPQDLEKLVGMSVNSVTSGMGDFAKGMNDLVKQKPETKGIDLTKISKDISTTVSGGGSTTVKGPDLTELTKNFEVSLADFANLANSSVTSLSQSLTDNSAFDDFTSTFDGMMMKMSTDIGDAIPLEAFDQTAAALEFATKRRQELEDLMSDGQARSGTEWNEIFDEAEQLDGQIENLTKKQIESITGYADGWGDIDDLTDHIVSDIKDAVPIDEFGDLEGAIAKQAGASKFDPNINDGGKAHRAGEREFAQEFAAKGNLANIDKLNADFDKALGVKSAAGATTASPTAARPTRDLNALNLPGFGPQLKSAQAAIPKAVEEKKTGPTPAGAAPAAGGAAPKSTQPTPATAAASKSATLDDVVKNLENLNKTMGQLLSQTEDLGRQQVRATRANNSNVLAR